MRTLLSNPYFRRISKKAEVNNNNPSTFGGIALKVVLFLLITGGGLCAYIYKLVPESYMMYSLIGAGATTVITALLNYLIPTLTPLFGTLYCIAQGFLIGFVCEGYSQYYNGIIPIALGLTFMVIAVMLFLYATKIIKVGQRFKAVISTLFLASIVAGGIVFISSFFTDTITSIVYGNGWIGIGISAGALLIASLNLVVDFDNIAVSVKNKYSKKYEWQLAFGLVMTVIYIFIRMLRLVAQIMGKSDD
ncbi:Bax inhibitor-1/YccA family protein [Clostridiaceae bacterium M8S5]|nr:Bax inhibitor-1/YccA family protein [Clostridiaceae bacterium M8S5]WDV47218.1 Bax inhibitor-1/YccA family protein [Clostridiaceae bacterium M8S5]